MSRASWAPVLLASLALGVSACGREEPVKIALDAPHPPVEAAKPGERVVRIAVGGMITPREGMAYYRDFLRYLEGKIGMRVAYVDRESYAEINGMLREGRLEAAFVCSGPYVDGHAQFGLELLAAPQAYGQTVYHAYIIVPKGSPARSLSDLRGKRFAFTDPLSNTGKLVPTYLLAKRNETPESFFKEVVYTKAHDKSIKAVAQQVVDGAAVDSLIWEYLNATNPEYTAQTRILEKSPPYAIPPVAVPRGLDPQLKEKLRAAFLEAHTDPVGSELLRKMRIDRFVIIPDGAYDSVREMQAWVAAHAPGK